jgi:hypothetical protein
MNKSAEDRLIDELVADAFAPFEGLLPEDALALFRDGLADELATHPHASMLVRRALPDPMVHASGDVERDVDPAADKPNAGKAGTGKR